MKYSRLFLALAALHFGWSGAVSAQPAPAPTPAKAAEEPVVDAAAAVMKNDPRGRFLPKHEAHLRRAKEGPIGLLFLGDSITERWDTVPHIWQHYYGAHQPANFGIGGDETHHVIWRLENGALEGINPKVVVLLIGTNNTGRHNAQQIAGGVRRILELIQAKLPETKVLLLAVFPRGPRRSPKGVTTEADLAVAAKRIPVIQALNVELAQLEDGKRVRFLDIGASFLGQDGKVPFSIMPDQVHLSPAGYQLWADAMNPLLTEMLR